MCLVDREDLELYGIDVVDEDTDGSEIAGCFEVVEPWKCCLKICQEFQVSGKRVDVEIFAAREDSKGAETAKFDRCAAIELKPVAQVWT